MEWWIAAGGGMIWGLGFFFSSFVIIGYWLKKLKWVVSTLLILKDGCFDLYIII